MFIVPETSANSTFAQMINRLDTVAQTAQRTNFAIQQFRGDEKLLNEHRLIIRRVNQIELKSR